MKLLIILIALSIASFSAFSAEGENQKSECAYANQSNKREAKVVAPVEVEIKQEATKNTSK